jgi:hypothetical protein
VFKKYLCRARYLLTINSARRFLFAIMRISSSTTHKKPAITIMVDVDASGSTVVDAGVGDGAGAWASFFGGGEANGGASGGGADDGAGACCRWR